MGAHLVWIEGRSEGRLPKLEEIRAVVDREWRNENRLASRKAINESLRDQYQVIVEWPDSIEARVRNVEGSVEHRDDEAGSNEAGSNEAGSNEAGSNDAESQATGLEPIGPSPQESSLQYAVIGMEVIA